MRRFHASAQSLDPDSLEWPFQYEEARPILEWISTSLRPSNVFSLSEINQYEQFIEEGRLLEGEDLDFANESILAFSVRRDNPEAVFGSEEGLKEIKDATLAYKAEALELQRQLKYLQSQHDMLTEQASVLIPGRRARVVATSAVNGQLTTLDDNLSAGNLQMNAVLGRIASTAHELAHYHSGDEDGIYLVYSDFNSYLVEDSSCIKELNRWLSKQLVTVLSGLLPRRGNRNVRGRSSTADCVIFCLRVSSLGLTNLEKSHHQRLSELQRLLSIFGTSKKQWVEAQVENAKQQAILMALKSQVISDEAHIHLDLHSLRRKHSELMREISSLFHREEKLLSEFLQHLVNHLAKHEFLKLACLLEKRDILGAFSLLKVIALELQGYFSSTKGRVVSSEVQEQGAVDDRDNFLYGVRDLLSVHSKAQVGLLTYVSAHGIIQQISGLKSDLAALQSDLENTLPEDRNKCINELCTLIQNLQQLLFASSTTAQPILTSRPLMKELNEMERLMQSCRQQLRR